MINNQIRVSILEKFLVKAKNKLLFLTLKVFKVTLYQMCKWFCNGKTFFNFRATIQISFSCSALFDKGIICLYIKNIQHMNYFYISKKVKDWSKYEDEKIITLEGYKIIITLSVKKGSIPILSINHTCKLTKDKYQYVMWYVRFG